MAKTKLSWDKTREGARSALWQAQDERAGLQFDIQRGVLTDNLYVLTVYPLDDSTAAPLGTKSASTMAEVKRKAEGYRREYRSGHLLNPAEYNTFVYKDGIVFRLHGTGDEFREVKRAVSAVKKAAKVLEKHGFAVGVSWYTLKKPGKSEWPMIYLAVWTVDDEGQPVSAIDDDQLRTIAGEISGTVRAGTFAYFQPWKPSLRRGRLP